MTIEFNIGNEESVILRPFKKYNEDNRLLFNLVDDHRETWIEIEVVGQK